MLPLILAGVAGLVSAGVKKTYDGLSLRSEAGEIVERATVRLKAAQTRLENATGNTVARIGDLQRQQQLFRSQISENLARTLARVASVDRKDWKPLDAAAFDADRLSTTWGVGPGIAKGLVKDTLVGVAAGAALGQGAMAAATSFGMASTGIAIGELSGAAATNASLAWLGGGAISTGGWGMAGGALALNALAIGPGALLAGLAIARHGEERKTSAVSYAADVDKALARERLMIGKLEAIRARVDEIHLWGRRTSIRAATLAGEVNRNLDDAEDCSFPSLDRKVQDMFLMLGGLTGLLNTLAGLAVINEAGELIGPGVDDPVQRARTIGEAG